ncbi:MAG: hypothetical protein ACREIF_09420 [Chthoniobacterales bacterium]
MKNTRMAQRGLTSPRALLGVGLLSTGLAVGFIAFGILPGASTMAQDTSLQKGAVLIHSYHNDVSRPLREMAAEWKPDLRQQSEAAENPHIPNNHVDGRDPVIQKPWLSKLAPHIPAPILNFDGIPYPGVGCSCAPPDTDGAVGSTQFLQIVNEGFQVFNKSTGNSVLGPVGISSVWSGFGGVCQSNGDGDPIALYDQLANRWIISQFAGSSIPTDECVAVSTSSDATGTWYRYGFHLGTNFFDYPKLAVWPDAYYMAMNVFNSGGTSFLGPQAFAMDRTNMLLGNAATIISMPILGSPNQQPMLPANLDGSTLPPSGAPNSFVIFPSTNTYRVYHFSVGSPFGTSPTFTLFQAPAAATFTQLCPSTRACVPQLGGTGSNAVDGIGDRLMHRLAYRNFGDHESLVGNFTVSASSVAGIRWFELRGVTSGPVTVYQQSTYQPDTTWRWMGSAAMDGAGNLAIGFSASSSTINPQIRYAGRLATDPLNSLGQGEAHLFDGTGSQTGTGNRWGDYSALSIDPVDDSTFWYTQEYYASTGTFNWRTRIGSFKFPATPALLLAASRLTHGGAGTFDVNMPLTGTPGVEDRLSSTYTIVLTFSNGPITSGTATVSAGTGTAGSPIFSGNTMTVPLTGVSNAQTLTLTVNNVNGLLPSASVNLSFLLGDTTADGAVNAGDIGQTKSQSGNAVTASNFREDVTVDGNINAGDIGLVKSESGTSLP